MYMSLQDLREKFVNDNTFAQQFVNDAREVGITVNILDQNGTGAIDEELLYGNDNLLNTYVNVVQRIISQRPRRLRMSLTANLAGLSADVTIPTA